MNYTPPKVWTWSKAIDEKSGGRWAKINRPVAGPTHSEALPVGKHPIQLYSLATPNGVKVSVMLEELVAKGHQGAEYDAWLIDINKGDQFSSGFVEINPNSKIPAMVDHSGETPLRVFESGSILLYLAEKFQEFIPQETAERAETINWLMWQVGASPLLGGGFGHFYCYAPEKLEYPINRYAMEAKRQLDVLDKQLEKNEYIAGENYTIADIAIAPWYGTLQAGKVYDAGEFLSVHNYKNVERWRKTIFAREAYQKGRLVNRVWGDTARQLPERHDAEDFDGMI